VSGQVVSLNGGGPIAGVSIDADGVAATSDALGMFFLTTPGGPSNGRVVLTAPQILSRTVFVAASTGGLRLDAIRVDEGGFDPEYYRQLVRNALDSTSGLQPIRRWTRPPSFYLRTVDDAGTPVDPAMLDAVEADIRLVVPIFSAGQFAAGAVERGPHSRETSYGWITVKWAPEPEAGVCGRAHVGVEQGGTMTFFYTQASGCSCGGVALGPRLVRHELGHAMGFWHTSREDDVMYSRNRNCQAMPTARERAHASIAYARPVGNIDPDVDPGSSPRLQTVLASD
jgi:hypothetical protein